MKLNQRSLSRRRIRHPKLLIGGIVLGVFLAVFGTYTILSVTSWQAIEKHSYEAPNALKTAITTAFAKDKAGTSSVAVKLDTIKDNFQDEYGANPCLIHLVYRWQTILPSAKKIQTDCNERFESALEVTEAIPALSSYLIDQAKAAELVAQTIETTKGASSTDFGAAAGAWKTLAETPSFSTSAEFAPVKVVIIANAEAVSRAFEAVANSYKGDDKAAFDAAVNSLQTAYTGVSSISETSQAQQKPLVDAFVAAYKKL